MMLKVVLLLMMAVVLNGCGSSTSTTTYYQLPTVQVKEERLSSSLMPKQVQPVLWVEQISIADHLAGNGLVYQTSDVKYVIARNNLWASPLDQQLKQALTGYLNAGLPGWLVLSSPPGSEHDTLNVNISGFHGRYDGKAVITGEWVLRHQMQIIKQPFALAISQKEDGYDALVRTLAEGWQQEAAKIAERVKQR